MKLIYLLSLAPMALASALPALEALGERSCVTKDMTYSSCTDCQPTGACVTSAYYHLGTSGSSCKDKEVPFKNNMCVATGDVTTPFGSGKWKEESGCSESNKQGTYAATVVPSNGSDAWSCSCVNSAKKQSSSEDCGGLEYACTEVWSCSCSKC